ncbi:hypothetical protein [Acidaminobacter hydrogenoformans]|uniref:Uncharacterized protein n=1 Tax=Acidaminobacter hydrogenoformans DSM 2784 TaxID=1120920 RepID=A0A1G5S505_9FIRM|nr:hypothetical protein [Acidaminobacter hydrogenoformans]SCZ80920.1 hypothetical protein SAMN03080599_02516 [Acidaminobacter hydrogenoformans DSM 2784]
MSEDKTYGYGYILWTTLLGFAAFMISGLLADMFILRTDNYLMGMLISGGIGALLLGLFLQMGKKTMRVVLAGLIAMPLGLLITFGVFEGIGALLPHAFSQSIENAGIPDTMAVMFMAAIFGAAVGTSLFGKKAIVLFILVCAIAAIPFGRMVVAFNTGAVIRYDLQMLFMPLGRIDLNSLAITLAHGVGVGLAIGIYRKFRAEAHSAVSAKQT